MLEAVQSAYKTIRADLLAAAEPPGHWVGRLASSSLATATAISALAEYRRRLQDDSADALDGEPIQPLIAAGLKWLATQQNADGGWGDTDRSQSNIATTMLVRAAFQLTAAPADPPDLVERADAFIADKGGAAALRRRYGRDRTFAVPILTNCAIAGMIPWRRVRPLPFELACLPQRAYRFLRLPVVSYAIPAMVAVGIARWHHAPPWNPIARRLRRRAERKSLDVIDAMQPASGGYLEAVPLTSFVVMSLASSGRADHAVVQRGVRFLIDAVRSDGSWPIDTNLATWVTTLAINALAAGDEPLDELGCLDWLLACQEGRRHAFTGAAPGGWAWTDRSGGVPDADDTAGALLALAAYHRQGTAEESKILQAASAGVKWLLGMQNRDGGWPTFCRGWGKLPFDRSGTDLTAHAVRALYAWRGVAASDSIEAAISRGLTYLQKTQRADGSWIPLWFGNEHRLDQTNPVYGTARVLLAFRDLGLLDSPSARRGLDWLLAAQDLGGGWGGGGRQLRRGQAHRPSSVEETAVALEALFCDPRLPDNASLQHMINKGLAWLTVAVDNNQHDRPAAIGFYFAKLWYYEKLYPLIFTTSALAAALRSLQGGAGGELRPAARDVLAHASTD